MAYPALHHRKFALLWGGLLASNVGTWMQNVAVSWLVYTLTGRNPIYLGWLGLAFAVPMVVLPPIGGGIVDRIDRVKLLYVTQSGSMAIAALLAVATWLDVVRPWHLIAATVAGAILLAFDNPARQALVPDLVPRDVLQNALSLNAATFTGSALVGPAIAGALLDVVGAGWLFFFNAVSFLAVLFALRAMKDLPEHPPATRGGGGALGGIAYALRERWLFGLLTLSAFGAVFARSYQRLLPVFAGAVFHSGAGGYGALLAAGGGGALVGALALSSARDIAHKGRVMLASAAALAASLALFALVSSLAVGAALLFVVGATSTCFTTMIATTIQLRTPAPLRGRVFSLYTSTLIGLPSLGALGLAAVAGAYGAPRAVLYAAAAFGIVLVVGARNVVRTRDRGD